MAGGVVHVGIDDTDSLIFGGCTTYIAALAVEKLEEEGYEFVDYPNIIRLNPNIPWKSRGNGAVALRIRSEDVDGPFGIVVEELRRAYVKEDPKSQPGAVALEGGVPEDIKDFAERALFDVVSLEEARLLIRRHRALHYEERGGRGLIGALAAIGLELLDDYTFELITYRARENYGKPRGVDHESAVEMDRLTRPLTFNNVDYETGRLLITPHGLDPVLYGIRGEDPQVLLAAKEMVKTAEPIERWVIYRTNHGTDMHFRRKFKIAELRPYLSAIVEGEVVGGPRTMPGGHAVFKLCDGTGEVDVAAYEPTGALNKIVKKLAAGDCVEAYGGVRPPEGQRPMTLNLEKLVVLRLAKTYELKNPKCPNCRKRMKSEGRGKGFQCKKCGSKLAKASKEAIALPRELKEGEVCVASARAHRHLTKPLHRYGLEKGGREWELVNKWHEP